jgi:hypothetical protein
MADSLPTPDPMPGKGLFGWLGRQVGYLKKAIHSDVGGSKVIYRRDRTDEAPHPEDPGLKLRRTVIDEVVQQQKKPE